MTDVSVTVKMENDYGDKMDVIYKLEQFKSPERIGSPEFQDDVFNYLIKNRTHGDTRQKKLIEAVAPTNPLTREKKHVSEDEPAPAGRQKKQP